MQARLVERIGERRENFKVVLRTAKEDVIEMVESYFKEV